MEKTAEVSGMVSNIQRSSMHDGPGIRSTVFLKGCNMNCQWCHNPETISFSEEMLFYPDKCIHCGLCAQGCFSGAKVLCGKRMTAKEVLEEVLLDAAYYQNGGGITVSGGEPCCQPGFTKEILRLARLAGIHTAIETNLNVPFEVLAEVLSEADLLMCDCKIADEEKHRRYTGVSNHRILQNLEQLSTLKIPVIIRTPVISAVNDTQEDIFQIVKLAAKLPNLLYYEMLPYHALGLSKGTVNHEKIKFETPSRNTLYALAEIALQQVKEVYIASKKYKGIVEK